MTTTGTTTTESPHAALLQLVTGGAVAKAVGIAAELNIADVLAKGPCSTEQLAESCGAQPLALERLLRLLATVGVVHSEGQRQYTLGPLGECLRTDAPVSMRSMARMINGPLLRGIAQAEISVRTGRPSFDEVFGAEFFEYLAANEEDGLVFSEAMTDLGRGFNMAVLDSYDFSGIGTLVDVGAGHGWLISAVLQKYPLMRGVLFDQPQVAEIARKKLAEADLLERCDIVGGDFFVEVPSGGDAYLLSWIIHDWDEERALKILQNCRRAMDDGGRLLLCEFVIPEGDEPHLGKVLDFWIMSCLQGRERTEAEYRELLGRAGFELDRVVPSATPMCVIEAHPVG
ncbi:MAG: methyltransferase [Actinomycetota bacterium]